MNALIVHIRLSENIPSNHILLSNTSIHYHSLYEIIVFVPELVKFQCYKCGHCYTYQQGLQQHLKYECGKVPKFLCPYCPYKCKRKGNLKTHVGIKHSMCNFSVFK